MSRRALACQIVLHANEAFPKGQGLFGGNPGSRASFRVRRGTDVAARFAAGEVPVALDGLIGDEELTVFKGPPVDVGEADVWEWTSPTAAGFGDPLRRDPQAVLTDIAARRLDAGSAARVYGVVARGGAIDAGGTRECREALRRNRLGGRQPGSEVAPPPGARAVGDLLHVVGGRWWCNGADLGPVIESYRERCVVRETPVRSIAPEFDAHDVEMADRIVLREYLCPVTGFRIDAELARAGEPPLCDMRLGGETVGRLACAPFARWQRGGTFAVSTGDAGSAAAPLSGAQHCSPRCCFVTSSGSPSAAQHGCSCCPRTRGCRPAS